MKQLNKGFPIDFPLNESGWTLLHVAADTGNLEFIMLLIEAGMDIDIKEKG